MDLDLPIIKKALNKAGTLYIASLQSELEFQKHIASQKLLRGFYLRTHMVQGQVRMDVMNKQNYMWTVNNGAKSVSATYEQLRNWALAKQSRGEIGFTSEDKLDYFINKVKKELEGGYYTEGGKKVAPRRYFFIDIAFKNSQNKVAKIINEGIGKEVDSIIKQYGSFKAIQLTV